MKAHFFHHGPGHLSFGARVFTFYPEGIASSSPRVVPRTRELPWECVQTLPTPAGLRQFWTPRASTHSGLCVLPPPHPGKLPALRDNLGLCSGIPLGFPKRTSGVCKLETHSGGDCRRRRKESRCQNGGRFIWPVSGCSAFAHNLQNFSQKSGFTGCKVG